MAVSFRWCVAAARCRAVADRGRGALRRGAARKGTRAAWFERRLRRSPVYDRYALRPGARIAGPAIIEEREATTVIPPGDSVTVDATARSRSTSALAAAPAARVTA